MSTPVEQVIAEAAQDQISTAMRILAYEVDRKIGDAAEKLGASAAWIRRLLIYRLSSGREGEPEEKVMGYATDEVARKIAQQMLQVTNQYANQRKEIAQ